ncbi:NAD-dependent epimerase/dehydratase family protein [Alicyclobacillus fastidiosus]|uniref:NAD(P)-dependent oxidoreductase n=1 Tax=Alicyclobacillus fastidiosus TaxID=392011 RepID=A0ABV5AA91_9BACL|nr:NAD(P)-dependent oxidoreductase [Alicyclobacillus fastidiosus]WEH07660.1 NAD(P)-dependent oxidoreductase [Alicyclobacillus fastidiosus]
MRVVVIGATGHIGTYLVPRLVEDGHEVVAVSRGNREPYRQSGIWRFVNTATLDRTKLEADGTFGEAVRALRPDAVIDLVCFSLPSAQQLVEALCGQVEHLLHCGTIWVHGPSVEVPALESQPRRPFGDYGIQKAQIEAYLLHAAHMGNIPATVLHPGHIVGPGWSPLNPAGHFNPDVFGRLARGEELALPNLGLETVHHVHADDVAQAFVQALRHRSIAVGESYHVVSPAAISLRGYAECVARWFGRDARLKFLPWDEFKTTVTEEEAAATWDHIAHSPNASIAKARTELGYCPRYSSMEAVKEAVEWLMEQGIVEI